MGIASFRSTEFGKLTSDVSIGQKSSVSSKFPNPITSQFVVRGLRRTGLYAKGSVNGLHCLWVIDTGAEISVVRPDMISSLASIIPTASIRTATGVTTPVVGKMVVQVTVADCLHSPHEVLVANIEDQGILGVDFLSAHNCVISTGDSTLYSGSRKITLQTCRHLSHSQRKETPSSLRVIESVSDSSLVPPFLQELLTRSSKELDTVQRNSLVGLLNDFNGAFAKDSTDIGKCTIAKHSIDVGNNPPIKQAARRLPLNGRKEVEKLVEDMKSADVIEPSSSPWASPIVLVNKKDGSKRFCIDYRKLNEVTKKDAYPLPQIGDTLDLISGARWFSTIDLQSGYWQIEMNPLDKTKTAFVTGLGGLWQFKVMPFGLCNAPATFERAMEVALEGLIGKICLVYLDDIIVFGKTFHEELENLKQVFTRLLQVGLKMSPKKCHLFKKEVTFLGHVVSANGVKTDPSKIEKVLEWPRPNSKDEVQSFLGLCTYYRRFVKGFASIARPLHALTGIKVVFDWTPECEAAFVLLKKLLTSSPILAYPIADSQFIVDTDASLCGIGGVLSQIQDNQERVISYFSRVLSKPERNYCVTRRELLAMVKSISHFHHYLYGRKFLIRTDNASLTWLLSFKSPEGQVARWLERLGQYDFEIKHRPGVLHGNADALSRRPCGDDCKQCTRLDKHRDSTVNIRQISFVGHKDDWIVAQKQDPDLLLVRNWKLAGIRPQWEEVSSLNQTLKIYWAQWDSLFLLDQLLYRKWESPDSRSVRWQLLVPKEKIVEILSSLHDSPCGGHFASNKTLGRIRERYFWAHCRTDVENWCRTCSVCLAKKGPREKGKSSLQVYNVGAPFERVAMDILGPLPLSRSGNRYALVIADYFTKWLEVVPIPNQEASTVARAFVREFVCRYGAPLELHTDQGRNFESNLMKEILQILGIRKTRTTALHPQSNGMVERLNRTLLRYLSSFVDANQKDWDEWIPLFLLSYRSAIHDTTGYSPAMMLTGRDLRLPSDLEKGVHPSEGSSQVIFNSVFRRKLEEVHEFARERIRMASDKTKDRYDIRARNLKFEKGDSVWLFQPRRQHGRCPKLQSNWEGPYFIIDRINDVVYRIRRSPRTKSKVVHLDRLAPYQSRTAFSSTL